MSSGEGATHRGRRAHDQRARNTRIQLHGELRFYNERVRVVHAQQNIRVGDGSIYAADGVRQVVEELLRAPSRT